MKAFTASDRRLNSAYSFDFLYADELTASLLEDALAAWPGLSGEGWPSWAFSNHDAPRALSRWAAPGDLAAAARLYLMLLMSLRGNVFVYQGEELGLPQAEVPFERLQDPEAIANWPMTLGRDGARTPLPWAAKELNAGFSSGSPWLPIDPRHVGLAIDAQADDPHSILSFARKLIASRRASPALKFGGVEILDAPDGVFALKRASEEEEAVCVFNLGDAPVEIHFIDVDGFEVVVGVGTDRLPKRLDRLSGFIAVRKA
jgi:alpha-glucosidase